MKLHLVPDSAEPEAGQIFVDVCFDGDLETCFLDTGATSTKVLHSGAFSAYSKILAGQLTGLGGKEIAVDRIRIPRIALGPTEIGSFEIMRVPAEHGLIPTAGIDLFQNQSVAFQFRDHTLLFRAERGEHTFELTKSGLVLLSVNGNQMIWDTGAGLTTVDEKVIAANPDQFRYLKTLSVGDTVTPHALELKLYEARELKIADQTLTAVKVLSADFTAIRKKLDDERIMGALGYNALTRFNWHFDWPTRTYLLHSDDHGSR